MPYIYEVMPSENKAWKKWERTLGQKVPETLTKEKRDELLTRLLSLGQRNPSRFQMEGEAPEVGPMYRPPIRSKVVRKLDELHELLESIKEKTKKKKDLDDIAKSQEFLTKAKTAPEKELLFINPGRYPAVLAHEVGHASKSNLPAKVIGGAARHFSDNLAVSTTAALMGLAGGLLKSPAVAGTAMGIGALQGASRLTEEGRASLRGLKLLREAGYEPTPEEKKTLRKAWASYLAPGAMDVAVPGVLAGLGLLGRMYGKYASSDEELRKLVKPTLFNKFERAFVPGDVEAKYDPDDIRKGIRREAYRIQQRFGLKPKLTGSMHSGLNLPDSVDIDFFADVQDKDRYREVVDALEESGTFQPSPYNKPDSDYAVFTRKDPGTSGFPVDLAVAYGGPGAEYRKATANLRRGVTKMDPKLKSQLLAKKQLLRDTPFFGKTRYRRFKRKLRETMDVPTLTREKLSYIVDPTLREEKEKLLRFLKRKDIVGHRTTAGRGVVEMGGALPASELYRRGLLQNFEAGRKGDRQVAAKASVAKIRRHLKDIVYGTRRGLLQDPEYGDVGFVSISRTAKDSPFLNLISDEAVVPARKSGVPRKLGIGKGYVFGPKEQIEEFEKLRPEYKYVAEEDLDPDLQKALYKPSTRSLKEVFTRILPHTIRGDIKIHPLGGRVEPGYGEE